MTAYPCVLTIAGSDSGGGAGIQADLKTFSAHRVYGASVITAVTAQNTVGVRALHAVPVEVVAAQLDAVLDDLPIVAIKIGMLAQTAIIRVVAERLRAFSGPVVLDPILAATSGDALLPADAIAVLTAELLPRVTLVTPNLPEAARLLGRRQLHDPTEAAQALRALGAPAVLLKGGHGTGDLLEDVLATSDGLTYFRHPRLTTPHTHGTGCTLSAAIAANMANRYTIQESVERAIAWLQQAITHAWPVGAGHGPVHHYWEMWED